ncbi:MAG: response regulator [Geobacteraceae bacterium]|nr:MAG: response regulator [Geobacteraceae bacterium]
MSLVGNLEDLGLGEILQIVSLSRKSGALSLHSRGREGNIVFRQGQVVKATSTSYQQNLGEVLIQKGIIDLSTLKKALLVQDRDGFKERLGVILTNHFGISAASIEEVVREQIEKVVYSLFAWAEGTFDFELQDNMEFIDDSRLDPLQFMLDQGLNPQFLAMEGSRLIDEKRHFGEPLDEEELSAVSASPPEDSVDLAFDLLQSSGPAAVPHPSVITQERRKMVLVDDDAATLENLVPLLQTSGYDVSAFEKSEEALIQVDTLYRAGQRPTIVIDLIMPRMDGSGILGGLELLELTHSNFPDLPTLAMADYHNSDAERKVGEMGVAFVIKPRRAEISAPDVCREFTGILLQGLKRVESGERPAEWSDKVNIGDEIRLEMGEEPASAMKPVEQSTGISLLRGMLDELNNPALGGGIILLVLRFASEFMNRAVIFVVKKDEIVGLGQFGINDNEGFADAKVRNLRIPKGEASLFSKVIESQLSMKIQPDGGSWDRYLFGQLGGAPDEVFLGPIVSEGKVVAVLYGDNLPEQTPIGDTDSLEIFLSQAGMAMEKLLLERKLKGKGPEGM